MPWDFKYRVPLSRAGSVGSVCAFLTHSLGFLGLGWRRTERRTEVVANKKPETSGIPSRDRAS